MNGSDIALVVGALVIVGFVALLVVILRAMARTAETAKEVLAALAEIQAATSTFDQLDGAAHASGRATTQVPASTPRRNGSGGGTEVPS